LAKEGFRVEDQGVGPDGGVDIIATQKVAFQAGYERSYKWAVQAKYRRAATTAVTPHDLGNIGNLLSRFEADGFLLITNGRPTNKCFLEIRSISQGKPPTYLANVWDNRLLESKLFKHDDVRRRYFGSPGDKAILVVDDQRTALEVVDHLLSSLGHTVYKATSAHDAIALAESHEIDLAILDIVFAGESHNDLVGFAIAKRLREIRPDVKIIYNSGYIGRADIMAHAGVENAVFLSKFELSGPQFTRVVADALETPKEIAVKATQFEAVTTFVSSALHGVVSRISAARLLADSMAPSHDAAQVAEILGEALASMKAVMRDLALEQFRVLTGGLQDHDLLEIVRSAIGASEQVHPGTHVIVDRAPERLAVHCERRSVEMALSNLIDNAFEAIPQGSEAKVALEVQLITREKDYARITISDSGSGVPIETVPRLYQPGFTTKGGSGMGFFLANQAIEYHGGWIEIRSPAPPWSTEVAVFLPVGRLSTRGA
jgi:signal transduction histidine kinase